MQITITTPNKKTLVFTQIPCPERIYMPNGILTDPESFFSINFEVNPQENRTTLFREFHVNSPDLLTAQFEQAALNLMLQYALFELSYEDGVPSLSYIHQH